MRLTHIIRTVGEASIESSQASYCVNAHLHHGGGTCAEGRGSPGGRHAVLLIPRGLHLSLHLHRRPR